MRFSFNCECTNVRAVCDAWRVFSMKMMRIVNLDMGALKGTRKNVNYALIWHSLI